MVLREEKKEAREERRIFMKTGHGKILKSALQNSFFII
jgi:hypothetical protein